MCLYCDKILKQCIENYLAHANKKLNSNFKQRNFKGKRGGPKRKRRGGGSSNAKNLNW
jgi:hypothetical protein